MMGFRSSMTLRLLAATSVLMAALLAVSAWGLQRYVLAELVRSVQEEAKVSLTACESLWRERGLQLARNSLLLSAMSDVRAAFGTRDRLTIQDTAGEFWSRIAAPGAVLAVIDPAGRVQATVGPAPESAAQNALQRAMARFPEQTQSLEVDRERVYFLVTTPVYVEGPGGATLLSVLVAGYPITPELLQQVRGQTGDSEFVVTLEGRVVAATIPAGRAAGLLGRNPPAGEASVWTMDDSEYAVLTAPLEGGQGKLHVLRSYAAAKASADQLRGHILWFWLAATLAALLLSWAAARRVIRPVQVLSEAFNEVSQGNYEIEVPVTSQDEIGTLARGFNAMCAAIRSARKRLVDQERFQMIGRLAGGIVHDLRNPLAAISAGAELMAAGDLEPPQRRRLSSNVTQAARRIEHLLQDLLNAVHQRTEAAQPVDAGLLLEAAAQGVRTQCGAPVRITPGPELTAHIPPSRAERALVTVLKNAVEAGSREITLWAEPRNGRVALVVDDTGPGVPEAIRRQLFEPFVTGGKANGLGLGLAVSRESLRQFGGDLVVEDKSGPGARFAVLLPRESAGD
jgi:signal transduction histidine kinase